ncbi:MAG: hypothetical protein EZS28_041228, partial [Streblomastix strix]
EKWLDQVFSEALQIRDDIKFAGDVPQRYEEHVIGYDCSISYGSSIEYIVSEIILLEEIRICLQEFQYFQLL